MGLLLFGKVNEGVGDFIYPGGLCYLHDCRQMIYLSLQGRLISMATKNKIEVYDSKAFMAKFMPSDELKGIIKGEPGKFFIVKVEEMYRLVTGPVPASRATTHTCIFITEGEGIMKIASEQYTTRKDQVLFVPAGQVFSFLPGDVHKGYLCNFHSDMLTGKFSANGLQKEFEFLQVWGNPQITLSKQTSQFVLHLFKRLFVEYSENGLANLDLLQPYFITLLCEINKHYESLQKGDQQTSSLAITNKFKSLMFHNIRGKQQVTDYALLLNISPNHLNKTVKATTGKPAIQLINEAIVAEAKILLSQCTLTISEVAAEVGIDDPSYFARLFKKHEGIAPTVFKKMIEKS